MRRCTIFQIAPLQNLDLLRKQNEGAPFARAERTGARGGARALEGEGWDLPIRGLGIHAEKVHPPGNKTRIKIVAGIEGYFDISQMKKIVHAKEKKI